MDTEYVLDCAFELAETTAVENAVLSSPRGAYWAVRETVEANLQMPEHFLQNTARDALNRAPLTEQYFFALAGLGGLEHSLKAFAERAAYAVQARVQRELSSAATPLREDSELQETGPAASLQLTGEQDIGEGLVRQILEQELGSAAHRWSQDLQLMQDAVNWHRADGGRTFTQMLTTPSHRPETSAQLTKLMRIARANQAVALKRVALEQRSLKGKAKAAIKKATKLFQNMGQERNLQLFVSGAQVSLAHPDSKFKFVLNPLQQQGWLVDRTIHSRGHTPYELSLYTKTDVFLAKLCVFFSDTPVLDQLLALTLFVESGDELAIMEKANWFATGGWTAEKSQLVLQAYPELQRKLPQLRTPAQPTQEAGEVGVPRGYEVQLAFQQDPDAEGGAIGQFYLAQSDSAMFALDAQWEPFKGRVTQWVATWMAPALQAAQQLGQAVQSVQAGLDGAKSLNPA